MFNKIKELMTSNINQAELLSKLKELKTLLIVQLLSEELKDFKTVPAENQPDIKKILEDADRKMEEGKAFYLLHRATNNNEYQESEINILKTEKYTDWKLTAKGAEIEITNQNPVVTCWIDEDKISVTSGSDHDAMWGKSPQRNDIMLTVEAGEYTIQEVVKEKVM